MLTRPFRAIVLAAFVFAPVVAFRQAASVSAQVPTAADAPKYVLPPQAIVDVFDAEFLPQTIVSPNQQIVALTKARAYPTIAELAQPMLRLAGSRVNPKTNGPHRASGLPGTGIYAITLKKIADGAEVNVTMPPQARDLAHQVLARRLEALVPADERERHRVVGRRRHDRRREGGRDRRRSDQRHDWRSVRLAERQPDDGVRAGRRAAAGRRRSSRRCRRGRTCTRATARRRRRRPTKICSQNAHDDALFDYYFTSQLAAINTGTGAKTPIGRPAIFASVTPSPAGQQLLVSRIKKPFSHLIPMNGFPQDVEVWTRAGELAKQIAELPSREGVPLTGVEPGPRSFQWRADQPATIVWVEALDGGDLKNKVPFRDKVRVACGAVHGPADRSGENRVALRRHRLHRSRRRAAERERSRIAPHAHLDPRPGAAPAQGVGSQAGRGLRQPGHAGGATRQRHRRGGGRGGGSAPIIQNGDYIYLTGAGRLAGRRSAVPRSAEREDAADRAHLQVVVGIARIVRRAAERRDDALPHALRDAEGSAEPLRARRRRDGEARGDAVQGSAAGDPRHPPPVRHLQAQGRRHAVGHAVPAARLPAGHESAGRHVGLPARVRRRRLGQPGVGIAELVHRDPRRLAHVPAALGLRDLRQPDDADHRPGRDGERHLRRAAGRERAGGDRQGGRDGRRRSRSHRRRRPQLRRVHDGEPARALAAVPRRLRGERRLQPIADAVRLPGRAPHVLGGAGSLREDVAVLVRAPDQGSDPADARRGRRQLRHVPDPVRAVCTWRSRATARRCAT